MLSWFRVHHSLCIPLSFDVFHSHAFGMWHCIMGHVNACDSWCSFETWRIICLAAQHTSRETRILIVYLFNFPLIITVSSFTIFMQFSTEIFFTDMWKQLFQMCCIVDCVLYEFCNSQVLPFCLEVKDKACKFHCRLSLFQVLV